MGLINTNHKDVVKSLANFQLDLIKNPYYLFNDKKAGIVTYFNLNKNRSTLDEALKIQYSNLGEESPLRFNKINNFYLYGLDRIATDLENGDYGIESVDIIGEALVLPNTITPYPGDYFTIDVLKQKYLFRVTKSTPDTLNNGGNYWRVEYKIDQLEDTRVMKLVVDEFEFSPTNIGTNFNSVIKKTKWDLAKEIDARSTELKKFYKALYFNDKVQTFTYVHLYQMCASNMNSEYFYDPYLMDFIIKNDVLSGMDEYMYIGHKTSLPPEFPIRYSKSIWRVLESKNIDNLEACILRSYAVYIWDPATIFQSRFENYFELVYYTHPTLESAAPSVQIFDPQVIDNIKNNELFDYGSKYDMYNIIIKYLNNQPYTMEDIVLYDKISDCDMTEENYFLIPMVIFCLDNYTKSLIN